MDKRFLFVHLNVDTGWDIVNHGIAYLVPITKKYSYNVACLIIDNEISCEEFKDKIDNFNPSIVAFSSTSGQFKYLAKYSRAIGKDTNILQIAGGVGPTLDPEWILSRGNVQGVCVGEGEIPLNALLTNIEKGENIFATEGFYWYMNGEMKKNLIPQFIFDLSLINFPDYTIFGNKVVIHGRLFLQLSRGCPYNCTFCCNYALKSIYPPSQEYFRLPSVDYSIRLIEKLVKQYPETQFIAFQDDLLTADKIWFKSFSEEYIKKIHLPYQVNVRVECINSDIVRALKYSGCTIVHLGLESGNEYLRNNLMNKGFSNNLAIERCKMIKQAGLKLFTYNMVGFPFEGRREMKDTLRLNKKIAPDDGRCFFFCPYKGTKLYETCKKHGLLKSEEEMLEISNIIERPCIKMTPTQEKECIYFQRKITSYLYRYHARNEIERIVSDVSPKFKKYFLVLYYWIWFTLTKIQSLYRIVRKIYI